MAISFVLGIFGATGLMLTANQSLIYLQVDITHTELRNGTYSNILILAWLLGHFMTEILSAAHTYMR